MLPSAPTPAIPQPPQLLHHSAPCAPSHADVLDASATVREAITLSALLRLGAEVPLTAKLERVDAVLKELVRLGRVC